MKPQKNKFIDSQVASSDFTSNSIEIEPDSFVGIQVDYTTANATGTIQIQVQLDDSSTWNVLTDLSTALSSSGGSEIFDVACSSFYKARVFIDVTAGTLTINGWYLKGSEDAR